MKKIALIIAGGSGIRMEHTVPKQFIAVLGKPIIVYTMEAFEKHSDIDVIAVVCLTGWENVLLNYAKQYNITKLKHIIPGGSSGQESIRNGLFELEMHYKGDDIILIHDSIRPMVSQSIISDCIEVTKHKGNAIACLPCQEAMLVTIDAKESFKVYPRENLKRTQTPQGFRLKDIIDAHKQAIKKGIKNSVASCTLMIELGNRVYFSKGSEKNIKITVPEDIDIFQAFLKGGIHD